jgi:hypothetical protein
MPTIHVEIKKYSGDLASSHPFLGPMLPVLHLRSPVVELSTVSQT